MHLYNLKIFLFVVLSLKKEMKKVLGEIFCYFILETILISKSSLRLNPFDQPSVELIKKETKKQF